MKPIVAIIAALLALAMIAWALFTDARAHEALAGWSYSSHCCSNQDCAIETEEVRATADGWLVTSTGELVPYGDYRIQQSQDGDFHRCQLKNVTTLRCLYVPPMGF